MAIIIIFEKHSSPCAADLLRANVTKNIDICLEDSAWSTVGNNKYTTENLRKIQHNIIGSGQDVRIRLYEEALKYSEANYYAVDNAFETRTVKMHMHDYLFEYVKSRNFLASVHASNSMIFWRDKIMASELYKLQIHEPTKNFVLVVGGLHRGIIYHLLYLQKINQQQFQIRFINAVQWGIPAMFVNSSPLCFWTNKLPCPGISSSTGHDQFKMVLQLPEIQQNPVDLSRFCEEYEALDKKLHVSLYENLAKVFNKLSYVPYGSTVNKSKIQALYQELDKIFAYDNSGIFDLRFPAALRSIGRQLNGTDFYPPWNIPKLALSVGTAAAAMAAAYYLTS